MAAFALFPRAFNSRLISKNLVTSIRNKSSYKETSLNVDGVNVNYLVTGDGPSKIFLMPGALGTMWTDFKPQIEGFDKSKFTIYAWDPPGYGKSRPPNKKFHVKFFKDDATVAAHLMKALDVDKYSILGWSDGGITALILAANYSNCVDKLVVWGANAFVNNQDVDLYNGIRDISKWSDKMRQPLVELYTYNGLESMWSSWVDTMNEINEKHGGNICKDELSKIKAKTLIIHGDKDPIVPEIHPEYLHQNINNSEVYHFKDGKHNLHFKYSEEFKKLVEKFLLES